MLEISTKLYRKAGHALTREQIHLPRQQANTVVGPVLKRGGKGEDSLCFSNIAAWAEMTFKQNRKLPDNTQ